MTETLGTRHVPLGRSLAVGFAALFALTLGIFMTPAGHAGTTSNAGGATVGTTRGYLDGQPVYLQYERNYFCDQTVAHQSSSGCVLGHPLNVGPSPGTAPILYVVVPLFSGATTECPAATATTSCVDHPQTIDLSTYTAAFFGENAGDAFLPAHDHVVTTKAGNWWNIEVYAIPTASAWDTFTGANHSAGLPVAHSLAMLQYLAANKEAVGPVPTNLDLFFNVITSSSDPHPGSSVEIR
jgi:hypothetical protein